MYFLAWSKCGHITLPAQARNVAGLGFFGLISVSVKSAAVLVKTGVARMPILQLPFNPHWRSACSSNP